MHRARTGDGIALQVQGRLRPHAQYDHLVLSQYLRHKKDANDFRFAPLLLDDLSGLPPALVIVAGYDPLRDEGIEYAKRLIEAGNRVRLSNYEGMVHGFYLMGGAVDAARRAVAESAEAMRDAFDGARGVERKIPRTA